MGNISSSKAGSRQQQQQKPDNVAFYLDVSRVLHRPPCLRHSRVRTSINARRNHRVACRFGHTA